MHFVDVWVGAIVYLARQHKFKILFLVRHNESLRSAPMRMEETDRCIFMDIIYYFGDIFNLKKAA